MENVPPPDGNGAFIPLASPRVGQVIRGVILHPAIHGLYAHWTGTRNEPCWQEWCPERLHAFPRRWKAYIGIHSQASGRMEIAELTLDAVRSNPVLLPAEGSSLRGKLLILSRDGRKANGAVRAMVMEKPDGTLYDCRPAFRLMPALIRIYYGADEGTWPHWVPDCAREKPIGNPGEPDPGEVP